MAMIQSSINRLSTDLLIIGAGAAGCAAAVEARRIDPDISIHLMEKAQIERSGCLASGINAINAYLADNQTPDDYLQYVKTDSHGLVRYDLVYTIACGVNAATSHVESWGLPIVRANGKPVQKGPRSILIKGESIKPILAHKVRESSVTVLNRVAATDYIVHQGRVIGAYGFNLRNGQLYAVLARRGVIIATGGASGIYRTANTGAIAHRMWYSPFNTGAGYAMGIRAGAEMTGFEMRFIPTRIKDSATPTGVLAQTFKVPQVNILGEQYLRERYGFGTTRKATTCERLHYMLREIKDGRGPVCFKADHFTAEQIHELKMSLLDMSPAFVLQWAANNIDLSLEGIEIATSGPYITGGHAQSGYWIDRHRRTTVPGLYAAGDVAGGAPKKYVSGCWVEGFIAAQTCLADNAVPVDHAVSDAAVGREAYKIYEPITRFKEKKEGFFPHEIETKLQKLMDEYAGGIHTFYEIHQRRLDIARRLLGELKGDAAHLLARDFHELNLCREVLERIDVAEVVLAHLEARKETRWPAYQTRIDYPDRDDTNWLCFLNSMLDPGSGKIRVFKRPYHPEALLQGLS